MGKKRFTAEQIISKLREADVLQSSGLSIVEVCRQLETDNFLDAKMMIVLK